METTSTPREQAAAAFARVCETTVGQGELARRLEISASTVSQWARGIRPIPVERMATIERIFGGAVTRRELLPDRWAEVWPELAAGAVCEKCRAAPPAAPPVLAVDPAAPGAERTVRAVVPAGPAPSPAAVPTEQVDLFQAVAG